MYNLKPAQESRTQESQHKVNEKTEVNRKVKKEEEEEDNWRSSKFGIKLNLKKRCKIQTYK